MDCVPNEAIIRVNESNIFVSNSNLKVMLEEDYLALNYHDKGLDLHAENTDITFESKTILKEILLPEIEKEVNEGRNFAALRQIYHAVILATWYKRNLKESLLGKVYVNQNKIERSRVQGHHMAIKTYEQYIEKLSKGVYNYVREDYDESSQKILARTYFSGGADLTSLPDETIILSDFTDEKNRQLINIGFKKGLNS